MEVSKKWQKHLRDPFRKLHELEEKYKGTSFRLLKILERNLRDPPRNLRDNQGIPIEIILNSKEKSKRPLYMQRNARKSSLELEFQEI